MKRRGDPEGGSLRNPELTSRRRCVGTGSRVGRKLAQPGGLLPGQAFPQAGRLSLPPGPSPQPVRTPSFFLSGARRSLRASPPANGRSHRPGPNGHPATEAPHKPREHLTSRERGGAQRRDGVAATSGLSPLLLAITPRQELRIFREPFSFRAEGEVKPKFLRGSTWFTSRESLYSICPFQN
ncbi:hypothetical protein ACRRTK_010274 [Alexandromys fortis]